VRRPQVLVAGALVVTALASGACHGTSHAATRPTTTSSSSTTSTVPVATVKVEQLTGGTTSPYVYDYTVEYPQLSGLLDDAVQRSVNADLMKAASDLVGDFVAVVTEQPPQTTTSAPTTTTAPSPVESSTSTSEPPNRTRLEGKSDTTLLDARVGSFRLQADGYIAGAAHGFTRFRTLTFDLTTGKRLALADLFRSGVDYLGWLSHESLAQLQARPEVWDPQTAPGGVSPLDEHFAHFVLTPSALDIVFDEYQVGPYAFGTPHVTFPYAQLRPLLAPGPLDGR
jgi:hypothetical protein